MEKLNGHDLEPPLSVTFQAMVSKINEANDNRSHHNRFRAQREANALAKKVLNNSNASGSQIREAFQKLEASRDLERDIYRTFLVVSRLRAAQVRDLLGLTPERSRRAVKASKI